MLLAIDVLRHQILATFGIAAYGLLFQGNHRASAVMHGFRIPPVYRENHFQNGSSRKTPGKRCLWQYVSGAGATGIGEQTQVVRRWPVLRDGSAEEQRLSGCGVAEVQAISVQMESWSGGVSIEPVTHHRVAGSSEVQPDLVRPAGFRACAKQGLFRLSQEDLKNCCGRLTRTLEKRCITAAATADVIRRCPTVPGRASNDPGPILFDHTMGLERFRQLSVDRTVEGKQHYAAGFSV